MYNHSLSREPEWRNLLTPSCVPLIARRGKDRLLTPFREMLVTTSPFSYCRVYHSNCELMTRAGCYSQPRYCGAGEGGKTSSTGRKL